MGFDFIECFMTTFLRAHSWLNWVAGGWGVGGGGIREGEGGRGLQ